MSDDDSDDSELSYASSVTIPVGQNGATIDLTALQDNVVDGNDSVRLTATATGLNSDNIDITVVDTTPPPVPTTISFSLDNISVNEGETQSVTISIDEATEDPLTIAITSSDPTEHATNLSAIIPADGTSVSFDVTGLLDSEDDNDQTITLTASATGLTPDTLNVTVVDIDEPAPTPMPPTELTLTLPSTTMVEGASITGTLELDQTATSDVVITIESSDETEVTVVSSLTIDEGEDSIDITFNGVADEEVDGPGSSDITITASGLTVVGNNVTISVTDADTVDPVAPQLTLEFDSDVSEVTEGDVVTGRVRLNQNAPANLSVQMRLPRDNDADFATFDVSNVTIPMDESVSGDFTLTFVDDSEDNADRLVDVRARINSYPGAGQIQVFRENITILDNDDAAEEPVISLTGLPSMITTATIDITPTIDYGSGTGTSAEWTLQSAGFAGVSSIGSTTTTNGHAMLQFPMNGTYTFTLTVETEDFNGADAVTATYEVTVMVPAEDTYTISGSVEDDDVAVSSLACELRWGPAGDGVAVATDSTDSNGAFSFEGLIGDITEFEVFVPGNE